MRFLLVLSFVSVALFFLPLSIYMKLASLSYVCMFAGVLKARHTSVHRVLMLSAVMIDIGIVLFLEINRGAIDIVFGSELNLLQRGHVLFSSLALVTYFPTLYLGFRAQRKGKSLLHRRLGYAAFSLRSVGFLLMFSLIPAN